VILAELTLTLDASRLIEPRVPPAEVPVFNLISPEFPVPAVLLPVSITIPSVAVELAVASLFVAIPKFFLDGSVL